MVTSGLAVWKPERQAPIAASWALEPPALTVPLRPESAVPVEPSEPVLVESLPPQAARVEARARTATEGAIVRRKLMRVTLEFSCDQGKSRGPSKGSVAADARQR